jgi:ABC-type multidrug transport system fused ATPase/permease subunit
MGEQRPIQEWRWFARELRPYTRSQVVSVSCLLGATLLSAVDPLIIKWIIDDGLQQRAWMPVLLAVGGFCAAYALRVVLLSAGTYRISRTVHYAMLRLRLRLLRRIQSLDAPFFQRHAVGDLVSRLEHEIEQLSEAAANLLPSLFRIAAGITVTIAMMLVIDWRLALVTTPLALLLGALRYRYGPLLERVSQTSRRVSGERAGFLGECIGAALELQLLGAESYVNRRYGKLATSSIRTMLEQLRTEIRYSALAFAVMTLASAAVLLAGAWEYMAGRLTLGAYIAFYSYLIRLFDPLSAAVATYVQLKRAGGSIGRLMEIEDHEASVRDDDDAVPADVPLPAVVDHLAVSGVRFGYGQDAILRGVDVELRRGEKVALMGRSGSGKSTLAKLLVRLYDAEQGTVTVDGVDVRRMRKRALRRLTSFVPPTPSLFRGTIMENVLLGRRGIDGLELDRLAAIACFDSVLARFPDGWQHVLGPSGAGLSDGEKQRLGLLRALVRGTDVLILDEATGALDPRTEAELLVRLLDYANDRLVLFITHRTTPAAWADRVLLLEDGKLVPARRSFHASSRS